MKKNIALPLLSILLGVALPLIGQTAHNAAHDEAHLTRVIQRFQVTDSTMLEAIASLSSQSAAELHLGMEDILRDNPSDPPAPRVRFSLDVKNATVKEILDTLCQFDGRYTWSTDGASINIYPRATAGDSAYLLNLEVEQINLTGIPDPDKVFPPLHNSLPKEQLAYMQLGGDISYEQPWSVNFDHLTVRQLINRVAEHLGPRSSWVFYGSRNERVFTFQRGTFHVVSADTRRTE
jgi:hypothetical protein